MPPRRSPRWRFTGTLQASRQALTSARQLLFTHGIGELTRLAAAGVRTVGVRGLIRRAAAVRQLREDDARYRRWLETHGPGPSDLERLAGQVRSLPVQPLISIITPVFDTDGAWLRRCVDSVRQQIYPIWELCLWDDGSTRAETIDALRTFEGDPRIKIGRGRTNTGIAAASNAALSLATGAFAGFLDHDDELSPDALAEVVRVLADQPGLDILYSDEDKTDAAGERCHPHFKPDWSPELLRACMYTSHFTVMRRQLVLDLGGFRSGYDGAQDYDLMLRAVERTSRIAHVPKVLYHWRMAAGSAASSRLAKPWAISAGRRALEDHLRRTGLDAQVQQAQAASHFRVKYTIRGSPTVSLLLPCACGPAQDAAAPSRVVRALARTGSIRLLDVLVVCHGELPASWRTALGEIPHLVVEAPAGRATTPAALNRAAGHASGQYLMTLDPGLQLLEADWLETLVALSQLEAIGAVGPVLLQADGTVDSAGIVVGCGADGAAGAFHGAPRWTWGHVANALHTRDCTAVDTACLMTKRAVFERVNGFDETFDGTLLAVDYGLRLREAGFRVLVSPYAHARWASPRPTHATGAEEQRRALARWRRWLEDDPYYNPNFDRAAASFRLPSV